MKKLAVLLLLIGAGVLLFFVKKSRWDGKSRFTIIDVGEEVRVESFDPVVGGGVRFRLPDDLEMETVGGKGKWRAGVLSRLAQRYGRRWAADSVANYLGVGYNAPKNELGVGDRWRWWRWWRETEWREVEMVAEGLVREVIEADGQKVLVLSENWQPAAQKWLVSGAIANENLSVEVVNASGKDGSGNNVAKMIEAAGIKVDSVSTMKVESGETIGGECVLETPEAERKKLGVTWLMGQLGCRWRKGEVIRVVVGKDYGVWWKGG